MESSMNNLSFSGITCKIEDFIINYLIIAIVTIYGVSSIIVGEPAAEGQFKYVVSIQQQDEHHCSGIIIDEMHIITAAHAIAWIPRSLLSVVAGTIMVLLPSFKAISVQWVHIHPGFNRTANELWPYEDSWNNDIAVLQLSTKFIWASNIAPAPLIDRAMAVDSCDSCMIPGWNYEVPNSKKVVGLYWDSVYREHNVDGQGNHINLADHQRCFGDLLQLTVIKNENVGSPVVCDNYVVGFIVKGGEVANRPSILLEIFPYSDFLSDVFNDYSIDARQGQFPYSATLWYFGEYVCSGIVYDDLHIITVGRPIENVDVDFLNVIAGRILVEDTDYVQSGILVEDIVTPAKFKNKLRVNTVARKYVHNGIAVLTLSRPVAPELVGQLQLGELDDVSPDHICRVFRWFREYDAGEVVRKLKTSPAVILGRRHCANLGVKIRTKQFCAVNPYSKILAEKEDIGNPILCNGKVMGIMLNTISGDFNHSNVPVLFVNIHRYG